MTYWLSVWLWYNEAYLYQEVLFGGFNVKLYQSLLKSWQSVFDQNGSSEQ